MAGSAGNPVVGALAGYVASRVMDVATGWYYERQSAASKLKEEELAPGGTLVQLGKQIGQSTGRDLDDAAAGALGLRLHRTFGVTYGILATALVRRGVAPLRAGLILGGAAFVLVDEGTALQQMTDYPWESHARGVVGHTTLGVVLGSLLTLADRWS